MRQERILEEDIAPSMLIATERGYPFYIGLRPCSNHGLLLRMTTQRFCPACYKDATHRHRGTWKEWFDERKDEFNLVNFFHRIRLRP